jgi:PEGA domain
MSSSLPAAPLFARSGALPGRPSNAPRSLEATALIRAPQSRVGRVVMVGVPIAVAAVVGTLFLWPHTGRILINVNDAHGASVNRADIFVDSRKQCDTAPCLVEDVDVGVHEVKVIAEGSETPQILSVNVESRKEANATFTQSEKNELKANGNQAGVKLYLDDKEMGPLPQDIHDIPPGDHVIKVAGSERYQPLERHISIDKDKVEDLGTIALRVLKGKVTIGLGTPGARVFLASGADRRELPMLPISVDIDTTKAWSLQASKPGYGDYSQPISFDDGQAEKSYTVTLEPREAKQPAWAQPWSAPPQAPANNPAPAPAPQPAPAPAPQHVVAATVPQPASAPQRVAGPAPGTEGSEAFLNINSIPPSTCFLDGRSLGSTPKIHFSVTPGVHTVKFVNSDQGLSKTISVTVGAGETKPAVAKLN